jgi:TusA-related sulfurtransferase
MKVLVLCQRRDGKGAEGVEEFITRLSDHLLGKGAHISYVSPKTDFNGDISLEGHTDMSFVFGHNKETDQLEKNYDLIINHQCPAPNMNYKRIHMHLKEGGYLAIASYDKNNPRTPTYFIDFLTKNGALPMIIDAGFNQVTLDPEYCLFQKNEHDHTEYFNSKSYEHSIYTPGDKSEATNEIRKKEIDEMKKRYGEPESYTPTCFDKLQAGESQFSKTLMEILLNGRRLEDVTAEAHAQIAKESTENDDDLYDGGRRKRSRRKRSKRKRKTRK